MLLNRKLYARMLAYEQYTHELAADVHVGRVMKRALPPLTSSSRSLHPSTTSRILRPRLSSLLQPAFARRPLLSEVVSLKSIIVFDVELLVEVVGDRGR